LQYCLKHNQKNNLAQIYRNQAQLFIYQKKYKLAIDKATQAVDLAKSSSNKEIESESLHVLIDALEKNNDFALANMRMKEYYGIREELSGMEQKKQINRLNIQYQTREKEHQIEILKLENTVQERKLWQRGFLIAALIFMLLGLFLFYRLTKKNTEFELLTMRSTISDYVSQLEEIKQLNTQNQLLCDENILEKIKQFDLTEHEEQVLLLISKGYQNSEIAEKLFVSVNTIKTHTKNIFIKLNVRNRTEAARVTKNL
jgi:ATP/maltotriose-dependent transcriptional regulator MalT